MPGKTAARVDSEKGRSLLPVHETPRNNLRRSLGLFDATAIGLGAIIGAGVFVAIAPAVDIAGTAAMVAMLIAGVVALFNSLSSAQLASAYPVSGGTYAYGRQLINNITGFAAGWIFVVAALAADSAIALTFAVYLRPILPGVPPRLVGVAIAVTVTVLNYFGLRHSARANSILVVLKVGVLLFFIIFGLFFADFGQLAPVTPDGLLGLLHAAAILFFAYTGYARVATLGEEVKDPQRTIPRAILLALAGSAGLYIATLAVAMGLLGPERLGEASAPLSAAMETTGVLAAVYIISLGALMATFSVFLTDLMGISRVVFAMARNRDLPDPLSLIHNTHRTPYVAVLASGAVVTLLTAFLPLRGLVEAGSFGLLIYYGITNLSALLLPDEKRLYHKAWAVAGLISCFGLAFFLPWSVIGLELLVVAAGIGYYCIVHLTRRHNPS